MPRRWPVPEDISQLPRPASQMKSIQLARKRALFAIFASLLVLTIFNQPHWPVGSPVHAAIVVAGACLIATAIWGRVWTVGHLGRRKQWCFISDGAYSLVRHPLYMFSIIGFAGTAMQSGSLILTLVATMAAWAVFAWTARIEEQEMTSRFGEEYRTYLERRYRFLPKPSLWRPSARVWADRRLLAGTFRDALGFTLAVPVFLAIAWLHQTGLLPSLFTLP